MTNQLFKVTVDRVDMPPIIETIDGEGMSALFASSTSNSRFLFLNTAKGVSRWIPNDIVLEVTITEDESFLKEGEGTNAPEVASEAAAEQLSLPNT